jgi:hypothetical protein
VRKAESQDLGVEVERHLLMLRAMRDFVKKSYGETEEQEGGARLERELAMEEIERHPREEMRFSSRPTFILGHRRSGTTLLAWLLDSRPPDIDEAEFVRFSSSAGSGNGVMQP